MNLGVISKLVSVPRQCNSQSSVPLPSQISALLLKTCHKNKKSGECIEIRNLK